MSFEASFLWARMVWIQTRWMKFLEQMETIIPREKLVDKIDRHHATSATWRPRTDTLLMVKIYFLQQRYSLSDPGVEDAIYDRVSFQKFLDIDVLSQSVPDESTVCRFRHFLEDNRLQRKMFRVLNAVLEKEGLLMKEWTTVDATIVPASSSTKNKDKKRDPEMKSTKKWQNMYFGMKAHVWTDSSTGLIHSLECTSANVHDSVMMDMMVHGKEQVLYWDSAYMSAERKTKYEKKWIAYHVHTRWTRGNPLWWLEKQVNSVLSKVRARWERAFGVIKAKWWHRRVRYKWLYKNECHWFMLAWLCNMYMMRKKLLATARV